MGGTAPPQPWARGGDTYDWHAAAPTLFVFVLTATYSMLHRDLSPSLAPSQHLCMQPHLTPTSSPPTPLHPIAISILAINCLSGAYRWASPQCSLRTERPSISSHAVAEYAQEPWLYSPPPSPRSVRLWGVHRHRTGWLLVGVPFRSTLQTV